MCVRLRGVPLYFIIPWGNYVSNKPCVVALGGFHCILLFHGEITSLINRVWSPWGGFHCILLFHGEITSLINRVWSPWGVPLYFIIPRGNYVSNKPCVVALGGVPLYFIIPRGNYFSNKPCVVALGFIFYLCPNTVLGSSRDPRNAVKEATGIGGSYVQVQVVLIYRYRWFLYTGTYGSYIQVQVVLI